MVEVSIPTREGLLPRVGRVRPGRPWPELELVPDIQMFIRLLPLRCSEELINGLIN